MEPKNVTYAKSREYNYSNTCTLISAQLNDKSEIYSLCGHYTKFHSFSKLSTDTDESEIGRKSYDCNSNNYLVSRRTDNQVKEELNFELYNTQSMESSPYDNNTGSNQLETTSIPPKFKKWSTRRNYY